MCSNGRRADVFQASLGRGRFEVRTRVPVAHSRTSRNHGGRRRIRGSRHRLPHAQSPRRDLHGSHDAGHGRLPGRAVHQEQSAHLGHSHPHVHLAGRRPLPRPGACARRGRRVAQADQAGRRHQDALPAAPGFGSPHARANYFHRTGSGAGSRARPTSPPSSRPSSDAISRLAAKPAPMRRFRRGGSAIRAAAAEDVARNSRRARHFPAEGNRRAAQLHRQHARSHAERLQGDLATLLPATRTPELDLPTVMPERRPWGAISGWSLALIAIGWRRVHELAVVEPGRRNRRAAHRSHGRLRRARGAAREARGS